MPALKVIVLRNCGNFAGLFQTVEGAQRAAQKTLDEYHELYSGMSEDDLGDTEPLTTTTLEWRVERINLRGLPTGSEELGWEYPTARYTAENGYFTLTPIEVGP